MKKIWTVAIAAVLLVSICGRAGASTGEVNRILGELLGDSSKRYSCSGTDVNAESVLILIYVNGSSSFVWKDDLSKINLFSIGLTYSSGTVLNTDVISADPINTPYLPDLAGLQKAQLFFFSVFSNEEVTFDPISRTATFNSNGNTNKLNCKDFEF